MASTAEKSAKDQARERLEAGAAEREAAADAAARQASMNERSDITPAEGNDPKARPASVDRLAESGKASRPDRLSVEDQDSAMAWFLDDEDEDVTKTILINVANVGEHKIPWVIRPVDSETIRDIRRRAEQAASKMQRRRGQVAVDQGQINLAIVAEGTVEPDLRGATERKYGEGLGADATRIVMLALKDKFKRKPGLVDQIAGEILALSGYDDEDVTEPLAGKP